MRHVLLVLAVGLLFGCEYEKGPDPGLEEEIAQLESEKSNLQTHRDELTSALNDAERNRDELAKALDDSERDRDKHSAQVEELKVEIERLGLRIVELTQAALEREDNEAGLRTKIRELEVTLAGSTPPAPVGSPQSTARTDPAEKKRLVTAIDDLQGRITSLRAELARGNSKVSSLARAKVDVSRRPPANGIKIPPGGSYGAYSGGADGLILRRERVSTGSYREGHRILQRYSYRFVPVGPAIKRGDFRTNREKDAAIAIAKKEVLPLYEQLRKMQKELTRLRGDLVKN